MGRTKLSVVCGFCGKQFEKEQYEIKKSLTRSKTGKHFCGYSCSSKYINREMHGDSVGFGYYLNTAKKNAKLKNLEFDLDRDFLKQLWDDQNGICPYTKLGMVMNKYTRNKKTKDLQFGSLDRIDNSKGYTQDNVQFVCLGFNYLRNTCSLDEAINFLDKLK